MNELSTAEQLGKAVGTDRERKKATYPALHGLDEARAQANKEAADAVNCLVAFAGPAKQLLVDLASYSIERTK